MFFERAQSQNFIATWSTFSEKKNLYSATFLLGHLYSGDTTKLGPTIQEKGHLKPSLTSNQGTPKFSFKCTH